MRRNSQMIYFDEAAYFAEEEEYWLAVGWLTNQWNAVIRFTSLGTGYIKVYVPISCIPEGLRAKRRIFRCSVIICDNFVRHLIFKRFFGCDGRQDYYRIREQVPPKYLSTFLFGSRYPD